ncbi:MAG: hypothetical protein AAGC93_19005, partial [Cyanobacteria bacterium P01_F01_bin.53]
MLSNGFWEAFVSWLRDVGIELTVAIICAVLGGIYIKRHQGLIQGIRRKWNLIQRVLPYIVIILLTA